MLFTSKSPLYPFIFDSTPILSYNYRRSSAALRQNGEKLRNRGALFVNLCSGKESWFQSLEKSLSTYFQHGGCRCSGCTTRCNPLSSLSYALSFQIRLVNHLRHEFTFETLEKELK